MKYWFHDIGEVEEGKVLEVALDQPAIIRVMDEKNYDSYKNNQSYSCITSNVTVSPYKVKLPRTAHWFVVIDPDGRSGMIKSNIKVYQAKK